MERRERRNAVTVLAPAKLNLALDVVGLLPNGYHALDMTMQTITLYERVVLRRSAGLSLQLPGSPVQPNDKNTAIKAALAFFHYTGLLAGVDMIIHKNTPVRAGMAGGSADAAADPIPAAISASSSFVDKSFPPYRPEKSGRPIQQMHGKDPDQQSSDMPGKPVSYRYALKFLLFEIFHKRMGRGPQCVPLPIDHLTAHRWYAIFSYSAPAMRKNSAGDSTVTPKSLALDNLLPAFSPQTR